MSGLESSTVRPARPDDVPVLRALLEELHEAPPWRDDDQARTALASLQQMDGRHLLVAEVDSVVAGTLDLTVIPNLTRDLSPYGLLENIVVARTLRRRGAGRALIEEAAEIATAAGCYKLQLISAASREAAHNLYAATGFVAAVNGYRRYLRDVPHAGA